MYDEVAVAADVPTLLQRGHTRVLPQASQFKKPLAAAAFVSEHTREV